MPLFIAGAAIIGSGITAAVSSSAANKAANASTEATNASAAVQNRALDLQQGNTAVARATGDRALNALDKRFGLSPSTPAATGSTGSLATPAAQASTGTAFDPRTYLEANPDIGQYYAANATNRDFVSKYPTAEAFAADHYQLHGQQEIASGQRAPLPGSTPVAAPVETAQSQPVETPATPSAVSAENVNDEGAYTTPRPTVGAAPTYVAPTYRETAVKPLDVSLGSFEKSPDYEFQVSEGNRNILTTASATGGLESGAALKALQKFGQNLAYGDYNQWRDFTTGQYNTDRNFTANRDDAANAFNGSQAQNVFNAATSGYQYGNTLAQNLYNSDRDYASSRYDTRTGNLLSLAGIGQGAVGQSNSALGANANALSNGYLTNANTQGNAALASAGQVANAVSTGVNALAYTYGNKSTSSDLPKSYSI